MELTKRPTRRQEHVKIQRDKSATSTDNTSTRSLWIIPVSFVFGFVLLIAFIQSPIDAVEFNLQPPPKLEGTLAPNNLLSNAKLILKDQISGPESIAVYEDSLYTGTSDGKIVEIVGDKIVSEYKLKSDENLCGTYDTEPICGRPLGMRFDRLNRLIVVDTYLGLYSVDLAKKLHEVLIPGDTLINGKPLKFLNDFDIHPSGLIIFTDSSSKWDRRHFNYIPLEGRGNGRLLSFDPKSGEVKVLLDNLFFPNGVQISPDGTFVVVAELLKFRLIKYYISGKKAGQHEILIENLPGTPDNVRLSSDGHYWVGLGYVRFEGRYSVLDTFAPYPKLRNVVAKIIPARYLEALMSFMQATRPYGLIIKVSSEGKILQSFHDPTGLIPDVSEVADLGKRLILGSYHSKFIAQIDLD